MSYREARNFCEIMRSLGYNRTISIENFRIPNFKLVAEILYWFIQRFDSKADIPLDVSDDKDRVEFICACGRVSRTSLILSYIIFNRDLLFNFLC